MEQYLTRKQAEDAFGKITRRALSLPQDDGGGVRIAWPEESAPAWKREEDVCFLRLESREDSYCSIRDGSHVPVEAGEGLLTTAAVRLWGVLWVLYGPNSLDRAECLRHKLLTPDIKYWTAQYGLYCIPGIGAPVRTPELINGKWWERRILPPFFMNGPAGRT